MHTAQEKIETGDENERFGWSYAALDRNHIHGVISSGFILCVFYRKQNGLF